MYGDTEVMRRRAAQLCEQGVGLRALADQLVARTESSPSRTAPTRWRCSAPW